MIRSEGTVGARSARPVISAQLLRYLLVGCLCAAVDLVGYRFLLGLGLATTAAKSVSFVLATVTAYCLNRRWTFRAPASACQASSFTLLYGVSFGLNVGTNALALHLLPVSSWRVAAAWAIAGAAGSVVNFVALRALVFHRPREVIELGPTAAQARSGAGAFTSGSSDAKNLVVGAVVGGDVQRPVGAQARTAQPARGVGQLGGLMDRVDDAG